MSCNCSKCNDNKPCGCEDNPLHTPCTYTNCEDGNQCEEVICEECIVYCGTTFSWCNGDNAILELQNQIAVAQEQVAFYENLVQQFTEQYEEEGCPESGNEACEMFLAKIQQNTEIKQTFEQQVQTLTEELAQLTANQQCITIENGERLDVTLQRIIQMIGNGINDCAYSDTLNAPLGLSISNVTSDSAKITWQTVSSLATNINIEIIDITGGATNYVGTGSVPITQFSYTITGLLSDNDYAARVVATGNSGSCRSVSVYFKTLLP